MDTIIRTQQDNILLMHFIKNSDGVSSIMLTQKLYVMNLVGNTIHYRFKEVHSV